MLFKVSRGSFMPAPNVDSAVIRLDVLPQKRFDIDGKQFLRLVKTAFSERRKQLCNPVSKEFGIDKETVKAVLARIGMNPAARAEELSFGEFFDLYKGLEFANFKIRPPFS
jgi:16S rRNA (adenine1518-N6/adenine1519-N6)-dimethyltransferase